MKNLIFLAALVSLSTYAGSPPGDEVVAGQPCYDGVDPKDGYPPLCDSVAGEEEAGYEEDDGLERKDGSFGTRPSYGKQRPNSPNLPSKGRGGDEGGYGDRNDYYDNKFQPLKKKSPRNEEDFFHPSLGGRDYPSTNGKADRNSSR